MTDEELARIAHDEWRRRLETQYFKEALVKDYEEIVKHLISAGNTKGAQLEDLVRLSAKAKQLKEVIAKL